MKCPCCGAKLETMVTDHPFIDHMMVDGYSCPDCHYDSVYDTDSPIEDDEEDDD